MKCPEAVEWMHRYIDHDLNEEESSVLFEHMRNCPDCSEKFALLNEISAKLEELPKVTPRFSLVDSILPQLDEIDRARQEGSAAEDVPGTMVAAKTTSEMSRSSRPGRAPRRSRAYLTGAFGLAAAMILGVFIYQYEPRTVPNAEIAPQVAYDTSSSAVESSSSSDNAAPETEKSAKLFSDQADSGAAGSSPQEDPNAPEASEGLRSSSDNAGGNSDRETQQTTAPNEAGNAADSSKGNPPASGGGDKTPASTKADGPSTATPTENTPASQQDGAPVTGDEKASLKAIPEKTPVEEFADTGLMGIANFIESNQWSSPDGLYTAELSDQHVMVYRNDSGERKLLVKQLVEGNWVKGEWSEDGKTFTYETEKDGVSAAHVVHPEQTEGDTSTGTGNGNGTGNSTANQP